MPVPNQSTTTLSELYFVQALPEPFVAFIGKANFAGLADQSLFANNERTQFGYTGLVNNPILSTFTPYTPLGVAVIWAPNKENTVSIFAIDADGDVKKAGFDTVFNGNTTYGGQYQFSPTINGKLSGSYRVIGALYMATQTRQ